MQTKPQTQSQRVTKFRKRAVAQRNLFKMYLEEIAEHGAPKESKMARDALEKGEKL